MEITAVNKTIEIRFSYDKNLVSMMKTAPFICRWDPQAQCWHTPLSVTAAARILNFGRTHKFVFSPGTPATLLRILDNAQQNLYKSCAKSSRIACVTPPNLVLRPYQAAGVAYCRDKKRVLIADEMGCLSSDTRIQINRDGGSRNLSLQHVYKSFHKRWDKTIPTYTRSLCNGEIRLHQIKNVLYKGEKDTLRITLESGKQLECTPDHEIATTNNQWTKAENLTLDSVVLTNGIPTCKTCGKTKNIITYKLENGNSVIFRPRQEKITKIEHVGKREVYDVVMHSPYRNFVANGIIVHNCGKTIQSLVLANEWQANRVLIVCPDKLKLNWKNEAETWLTKTTLTRGIANSKHFPATDVVIINYESVKKQRKAIDARNWDLLICDEAQALKNAKAQRTGAVLGTPKTKGIQASRSIFLTGTPIMNRPEELWTIAHHCAPDDFYSWWEYVHRYCDAKEESIYIKINRTMTRKSVLNTRGASNTEELGKKLRSLFMVRRLKKDVEKDLPEKVNQVIEIEPEDKYITKTINKSNEWKQAHAVEYENFINGSAESLPNTPAFAEFSTLRKTLAFSKVDWTIDFLMLLLESVSKIVVFAHHTNALLSLGTNFPDNSVVVTGSLKPDIAHHHVVRFQEDPSCNLFFGSMLATGTGITLTAASHMVFVEQPLRPSDLEQCIDRCHRIGATANKLLIQHLVYANSLDSLIMQMNRRKQQVARSILDVGQ